MLNESTFGGVRWLKTSVPEEEMATAIATHAAATDQELGKVSKAVEDGEMVVVRWEGRLTLLFNSPNGL